MADSKKSFILYADLIHTVSKLPDEVAGKLFKIILDYVNDKNPVTEEFILEIAFEPIKQQLKRDLRDWEEIKSVRSESGILGNLKRWNNDLYKKVISHKISIEQAEKEVINRKTSGSDKKDRHVSQKSQTVANVAVNDNVNVNVNESGNEEVPRTIKNDLSNSNLYRQPIIPTKQEVLESFVQNGGTKEMAEKFYQVNESTGWFYKSSPVTNFRMQVYSFVENWKRNEKNKPPPVELLSHGQKISDEKARKILDVK